MTRVSGLQEVILDMESTIQRHAVCSRDEVARWVAMADPLSMLAFR